MKLLDILQDQPASLWQAIPPAVAKAKAALAADDSHDDIRDALLALIEALGEGELPDCNCHKLGAISHATDCPMHAWEAA